MDALINGSWLEQLAAANGLVHSQAHEALSDVEATIALAARLKERQPRLFDYALALRDTRPQLPGPLVDQEQRRALGPQDLCGGAHDRREQGVEVQGRAQGPADLDEGAGAVPPRGALGTGRRLAGGGGPVSRHGT